MCLKNLYWVAFRGHMDHMPKQSKLALFVVGSPRWRRHSTQRSFRMSKLITKSVPSTVQGTHFCFPQFYFFGDNTKAHDPWTICMARTLWGVYWERMCFWSFTWNDAFTQSGYTLPTESTNCSLAFPFLSFSDPTLPEQLQSTLWILSPASALGTILSKCHLQWQRTFKTLTCNLAERTWMIMHSIVLYRKG